MRNETELWRGRSHLKWLEEEYVNKGRLGQKTGEGLIVKPKVNENVASETAGQEVWKEHAVDLSGL
jgi:3-hydroxyacyl-CoA dehydrogenase